MFGCSPAQVADSAVVLRALATEWRELLAGSEGFLTGGRRGLEGQQVVWGEMDSFVRRIAPPRGQAGWSLGGSRGADCFFGTPSNT